MEFIKEEKIEKCAKLIFKELLEDQFLETSFTELEKGFRKLMYLMFRIVFQLMVDWISKKKGFEKRIKMKVDKKNFFFKMAKKNKNISTIFGIIKMPYAIYKNRTVQIALRKNNIDYREPDKVSTFVKELLVKKTPYNSYEKVNIDLYEHENINLSLSNIKRISNIIAKENHVYYLNEVDKKNKSSWNELVEIQVKKMVIENDGGKIRILSPEREKGRNAKRIYNWNEVRMGTAFGIDESGKKIKNEVIYYCDLMDNWKEFKKHIIAAFNSLGGYKADCILTISDCGAGVVNLHEHIFGNQPDNIFFFDAADFYHCCEHLSTIAKTIYPNKKCHFELSSEAKKWVNKFSEILKNEGGTSLLEYLEMEKKDHKVLEKNFEKIVQYFNKFHKRMNYPELIKNNLPIGSGEIESIVKYKNNKRFKPSSWILENACNLLQLQCTIDSNYFDLFWQKRYDTLNYWNVPYKVRANKKIA
jgi:hypothetical protein